MLNSKAWLLWWRDFQLLNFPIPSPRGCIDLCCTETKLTRETWSWAESCQICLCQCSWQGCCWACWHLGPCLLGPCCPFWLRHLVWATGTEDWLKVRVLWAWRMLPGAPCRSKVVSCQLLSMWVTMSMLNRDISVLVFGKRPDKEAPFKRSSSWKPHPHEKTSVVPGPAGSALGSVWAWKNTAPPGERRHLDSQVRYD